MISCEIKASAVNEWYYTVRAGDCVSVICERELGNAYGYTDEIERMNPWLDSEHHIWPGNRLLLPEGRIRREQREQREREDRERREKEDHEREERERRQREEEQNQLIDNLKKEFNTKQKELDNFKKDTSGIESDVSSKTFNTLSCEYDSFVQNFSELEFLVKEREAYKIKMKNIENEKISIEQQNSYCILKIKETEEAIKSFEKEINESKNKTNESQNQLAKNQENLKTSEEEIKSFESKIDLIQKEINFKRSCREFLIKEKSMRESLKESLKNEILKLQEETFELEDKISTLKQKERIYTEKIDANSAIISTKPGEE